MLLFPDPLRKLLPFVPQRLQPRGLKLSIQCWVTLNASSLAVSRFPLLCCPSLQKPRRRKRKRRKRRRKRKRWKWWVHTLKFKCPLPPHPYKCGRCLMKVGTYLSLSSRHLCYEQSTDTHCCRYWLAPLLCVCALLKARGAINCESVISEK